MKKLIAELEKQFIQGYDDRWSKKPAKQIIKIKKIINKIKKRYQIISDFMQGLIRLPTYKINGFEEHRAEYVLTSDIEKLADRTFWKDYLKEKRKRKSTKLFTLI